MYRACTVLYRFGESSKNDLTQILRNFGAGFGHTPCLLHCFTFRVLTHLRGSAPTRTSC